jgi:hypothetical protein
MATFTRKLLAIAIMVTALGWLGAPPRATGQSGAVVTPPGSYSDPGWAALATKYQGNLGSIQTGLTQKFSARPYRLLALGESSAGGIGFWASPAGSQDQRYLAVFARGALPPSSPFPDSDSGRVLQIMDFYGKDTIYQCAAQLKSMPEPQIAGVALIFIYGKGDPNSPAFEQNGEAFAMFIPRGTAMTFASLQMTIQSLFSASTILPLFKGGADIASLKTSLFIP